MKRMAIFSFFDINGIADQYIFYLLQELSNVTDKIIVVINGELQKEFVGKIKNITPFIKYRENTGFDAGAYKDVILSLHRKNELKKWDEIILLNNTFYGPFVSFQQIFEKMSKRIVDFWGLSYIHSKLFPHIQSYFLVFRKNIILANDLYTFFEEYIDEKTTQIKDVYACFETGIFNFLLEHNYDFGVYENIENRDIYSNSFYLLNTHRLPILKKKFASDQYFDSVNVEASIQWVSYNSDYDVSLIIDSINRLYRLTYNKKNIFSKKINIKNIIDKFYEDEISISKENLFEFIHGQKEVYIYGAGLYARKIYVLYLKNYCNFNFMGFLISDTEEMPEIELYGYPIYKYSKINNSRIIVALNKKGTEQIKRNINKKNNFLFYLY